MIGKILLKEGEKGDGKSRQCDRRKGWQEGILNNFKVYSGKESNVA